MDKIKFYKSIASKLELAVGKSGVKHPDLVQRYLTDEFMESLCEVLYESKLYEVQIKVYTDIQSFTRNELMYTNCSTPSRTVNRTIVVSNAITEDEIGTEICEGVKRYSMTHDASDVNIIVYTSVDSLVFNFYEEVLVLFIPEKLVATLDSPKDRFLTVVS